VIFTAWNLPFAYTPLAYLNTLTHTASHLLASLTMAFTIPPLPDYKITNSPVCSTSQFRHFNRDSYLRSHHPSPLFRSRLELAPWDVVPLGSLVRPPLFYVAEQEYPYHHVTLPRRHSIEGFLASQAKHDHHSRSSPPPNDQGVDTAFVRGRDGTRGRWRVLGTISVDEKVSRQGGT
jgi:hypothetical protein